MDSEPFRQLQDRLRKPIDVRNMTTTEKIPHRERRPSVGAPIVDIQGSVGPAGISRPKHKRTLTGFGAAEIQNVEGILVFPFCGC